MSVVKDIESLLREQVDSAARASEFNAAGAISPYLAGAFDLYRAVVLGRTVVFAENRDDSLAYGPLRKRLGQLSSALKLSANEQVVYFARTLPVNVRRAFLESGTPFATSDGDIYIPFLSFKIGAHGSRIKTPVRRFRGADRSVYLYGLYADKGFTQEEVMHATNLSVGSVSRALANLVDARAIDFEVAGKTGRKKTYFKVNEQEYYGVGLEYFGDAVQKIIHTNELPQGLPLYTSGLYALSYVSELLPPSQEIWAIAPQHESKVVSTLPDPELGFRHAIQVLSYDPAPYAHDGRVDPFTMLVTIDEEDRRDERVRIAMRESMEGYAWYQD